VLICVFQAAGGTEVKLYLFSDTLLVAGLVVFRQVSIRSLDLVKSREEAWFGSLQGLLQPHWHHCYGLQSNRQRLWHQGHLEGLFLVEYVANTRRNAAFLPPQGKEECHVFQAASLEGKRDFVKLLKIESCIVSNGKHHWCRDECLSFAFPKIAVRGVVRATADF
jgi:hypothetical protein